MVSTKATFQGAQFENVSRNLEFFILTTAIDITDNGGDTSTPKKLGQQQNLDRFMQAIMLRCNPIIMSIAKTVNVPIPLHNGSDQMFGSGFSTGGVTYWTMKFSIDYPKAYSGIASALATGQAQTDANTVALLATDLSGITIGIGYDQAGGGYAWSDSIGSRNNYIITTETTVIAQAGNRNTFISKTDIL
jgi:hypothetical protein